MKDEFHILRPVMMVCVTGMMIWIVLASCLQAAVARAQCEAAGSSVNVRRKTGMCRVFTPQSLPGLQPGLTAPDAE